MNNDRSPVGFDEFIDEENELKEREASETEEEAEDDVSLEEAPELDVQRAVVESLAEDKVKMEHEIESLKDAIAKKETEIEVLNKKLEEAEKKLNKASEDLEEEKKKTARLENEISSRIERAGYSGEESKRPCPPRQEHRDTGPFPRGDARPGD